MVATGDTAGRIACGAALRATAPSAWRVEGLRLLLAHALAEGDGSEAERLTSALPPDVAREEFVMAKAHQDPVAALAVASREPLSSRAWRAVLAAGAAHLRAVTDPVSRDLLASALCAALPRLSPAVAFLEAIALARCFAEIAEVDEFHLLALSALPGLSATARVDLQLAVGAALAARGAAAEAALLNAAASHSLPRAP